jgi:alanyl aminopeptidase
MIRRLLPALLLAAACADPLPPAAPLPPPTTASSTAASPRPPALRLPKTAAPVRYTATLTLVPSATKFEGAVDVDLTLTEPSALLWLNATALQVKEAHFEVGGRALPARVVPGGDDFLGFAVDETLPAGAARLHVAYQGEISTKDDRGVFSEREDDADYLFSQFENIEARRAFPCFDEPSFKVPWQLTLRVPEAETALSNTPPVSESKQEGGLKAIRFAETKPLPSYLVAFAVGPFDLVDAGKVGKSGTPLRIVAPHGKAAQAAHAAQVTGELLGRLEDYFGIPYPYEKLDVVAVPHLVSFGAMENAGLITFYEAGMLAKPEEKTISFEQRYAVTVTHEMAHQWFGDLVTMSWWDDVWLNEAFASWMESKILVPYRPDWRWELMRGRATAYAMGGDALVSARRIHQEILTKDDIQNAFDEITYSKGAAVIGMFEAFAGPERFRRGIARYLGEHLHGNATSTEFLAAVGAETRPDLAPAFSTFLDQPGVPLVHAGLTCGKGAAPSLKLSQNRYLPLGSPGAAATTWQIPVCVRWGAGKVAGRACTLMKEDTATLPLPEAKTCPDWVMLDASSAGYYHAGYTAPELGGLLRGGGKQLTLAERLSVIRDLGALVASGDLPVGDALGRIPQILEDDHPEVLQVALGLALLRERLIPEAARPSYARFIAKTFGARARAVGWIPKAGEDDHLRLLRPYLVPMVADRGDDAPLIAEAGALALRWLDDPKAVSPEVADAVVWVAATHGDRKLFDRIRAEAKKARDDRRVRRLIHGMASFRDPAIVRDALGILLTDELDPRVGIDLIYQDERMQDVVFDFTRKSFDALATRIPGELRADLPYVGEPFCDDAHRKEVEGFFKERVTQITGGPRNLAKVLERITLCSTLRKTQEASLVAFLKKY